MLRTLVLELLLDLCFSHQPVPVAGEVCRPQDELQGVAHLEPVAVVAEPLTEDIAMWHLLGLPHVVDLIRRFGPLPLPLEYS